MKKLYLFLVAVLIARGVMAQSVQPCSTCLPEGIAFSTQSQIDNFQVNYPNCSEIEGSVDISGNNITNLNGLNVLTSIGDYLYIRYNDSLTSLAGLNNLISIENLEIAGNDNLTSLAGLEGLTSIGGSLIIGGSYGGNNALTSLSGLNNLTSIGGSLEVGGYYGDNPALTSLMGLEGIASIGGNLRIYNNISLTSLTALENLTSIGGLLLLDHNDALTSLTALENLTSIGGSLHLGYNDALTNLMGLEGITSIGDDLAISGNQALTSLTALENLTSIGGSLLIEYTYLISLTGLDNINAGSITDLILRHNESLSTCAVQSICGYLAAPNGYIEIHNNATGCNSQEEVEVACQVGLDESAVGSRQSSVIIYPNPSSTQITIEMPTTPDKNTFITIFNINGQQIILRRITEQHTVLDVSGMNAGIYFVKVLSDDGVMLGKFVKQ